MRTYVKKLWVAESARVFSDARSSLRRDSPRRTGTEAREALAQSQRLILAPVGTEDYVQNEKWINEILLKVVEFGRDSLTTEEIEEVNTLAHSCPSVNGLGVYYARFLNAYYEPLAGYDDYALCNPASKGGKGPWDDMLSYLQNSFSAKYNQEAGKSLNNIVKAYPNPTNDIFNIAWDFSCAGQGNVELFDITGRQVLRREFNCNSGRCELSMDNFPSGLYTYKLSVGAAMYTGKLSKHD